MDRVFTSSQNPFSEISEIALAFKEVEPNQLHIGLLHKLENSQVLMLDLAWDYILRNSRPTDDYYWIKPGINPYRLRQVKAICREVWRSNTDGIPYGFSPPNDCFDEETGMFLLGSSRTGLTCATFVLAVLHRAGIQLVDYSTWPTNRPVDKRRQERILAKLRDDGIEEDRIAAMAKEKSSARFRPDEVAGAALDRVDKPITYPIARTRADHILEIMSEQRAQ